MRGALLRGGRRDLARLTDISLELVGRAKLWAKQAQDTSRAAVADLQRRTVELEEDMGLASGATQQLYATATRLSKAKLGAEARLQGYSEARRLAAGQLAMQRMRGYGLRASWDVWAMNGLESRRAAVAEERVRAKLARSRRGLNLGAWREAVRESKRERRALKFLAILTDRRLLAGLRAWRARAAEAAWTERVVTTKGKLAQLRAVQQCQMLTRMCRSWEEVKDLRSEDSAALSRTSAHLSKFVAC